MRVFASDSASELEGTICCGKDFSSSISFAPACFLDAQKKGLRQKEVRCLPIGGVCVSIQAGVPVMYINRKSAALSDCFFRLLYYKNTAVLQQAIAISLCFQKGPSIAALFCALSVLHGQAPFERYLAAYSMPAQFLSRSSSICTWHAANIGFSCRADPIPA